LTIFNCHSISKPCCISSVAILLKKRLIQNFTIFAEHFAFVANFVLGKYAFDSGQHRFSQTIGSCVCFVTDTEWLVQ
jgi:hypothetical protein